MGGSYMRERRGSGPENQAPAYSVSDKGPYDRLESKWYPNTINGKYEVV